jgi:5'-nucleotidase
LMNPAPDIVVSGINMGANVGVNVIYSGTVSAATEGTVLGVPSLAVSIESFTTTDFAAATDFILILLGLVQKHGLPPGVLLNVNAPAVPRDAVRGVRVTRQGDARFLDHYDRRVDPRDHIYYWLCGSTPSPDEAQDTDAGALAANFISVTPIHYDLTHYAMLDVLKKWLA